MLVLTVDRSKLLEAAWLAAERGHVVTVGRVPVPLAKDGEWGIGLELHYRVPVSDDEAYVWQECIVGNDNGSVGLDETLQAEMERLGIKYRLHHGNGAI